MVKQVRTKLLNEPKILVKGRLRHSCVRGGLPQCFHYNRQAGQRPEKIVSEGKVSSEKVVSLLLRTLAE
jgi:hypothetical protein